MSSRHVNGLSHKHKHKHKHTIKPPYQRYHYKKIVPLQKTEKGKTKGYKLPDTSDDDESDSIPEQNINPIDESDSITEQYINCINDINDADISRLMSKIEAIVRKSILQVQKRQHPKHKQNRH